MAVKLKCGAIFLHIPKTGGLWVEKVLQQLDLVDMHIGHSQHADFDRTLNYERFFSGRHIMAYLLRRNVRRRLGTYREEQPYKFCFVRNPLTWYESRWKYMMGLNWPDRGLQNSKENWHPCSALNGLGDNDFNTFVLNVLRARPGFVTELFYSYTKPGISYIGKTETLVDDLIAVLRELNVTFDEAAVRGTGKVNVSKSPRDAVQWDPKVREMAMRLELPAITRFGYLDEEVRETLGLPADFGSPETLQLTH